MNKLAKMYLSAGAPLKIRHGKDIGRLIDVQYLNDGYICGIYRFPGGDCCDGPLLNLRDLVGLKNTKMSKDFEVTN